MDFNDTPQQADFRKKVSAWLDAHAGTYERTNTHMSQDKTLTLARSWQAKCFDDGWACLVWSKEYGGAGLSAVEQVIWNQEVARFNVPEGFFSIGIGNCGPALMVYGSEQQKSELLPRMARGDDIWCQLYSEPQAGSDLAGLITRAEKKDGQWLLNGQKIWTSGAHYSDYGIVLCRTDSNVPKHKGLTQFFIDMRQPGVEVKPIIQADGNQHFNEVFFHDAVIPDEQRLGAVGEGWKGALTVLMSERFSVGTVTPSGFDEFVAFCMATELHGRPAVENVEVRQNLAQWYIRERGLKNLTARTLTSIAKGEVPGPEASVMKLVGATMMQNISSFAIDLMGYDGIVMHSDDGSTNPAYDGFLGKYLASPGMRVAGGTDEIMRNIIAEQVLGMPSEIRLDKNIPFKEIPNAAA